MSHIGRITRTIPPIEMKSGKRIDLKNSKHASNTRMRKPVGIDSARKHIEMALHESEKKFRTLTENLPVGIFRSTPGRRGRFLEVNRALVKILGHRSKKELFAKDVSRFYQNPGDRLGFSKRIAEKGLHQEEMKLRKKDGTTIVVSMTAIAVKDETGKVLWFDGIVEDITKRKHAEEELLLQKTYLEILFNSAPEAIVLHDNEDRVVDVNEEFTRMFGYTRGEAIGRHINDLVASQEYKEEAGGLSHKVIHGERVELDSRRRRKDGPLIDVSILGAPIVHGGKQMAIFAIYRDITERKKAEEARIRLQEESRMARNIQMNLLPKANPSIKGYDIAGNYMPAMIVGGDYYDFIRLDQHRLAIGLGDVSGKGLAASLVMANLQATIRGLALFDPDPKDCMERANKLLYRSTDSRTFVSLFYGILDTRSHTLCYASAGQDMPILFAPGKVPVSLKTRGIALGMKEEVTYEKEEIAINPGDRLLIYTDGVPEAMNSQMEEFGEEKLKSLVQRNEGVSALVLIEKILASVSAHVNDASQSDDMTIVLVNRLDQRNAGG